MIEIMLACMVTTAVALTYLLFESLLWLSHKLHGGNTSYSEYIKTIW